ncbi:TPA: selenocysteine-specific translation elongation factor [Candidatus Poribacteria bacterium]|nr:selenocysteine-specific translation elongation factor [Candidatus Poribacteria bacterium]
MRNIIIGTAGHVDHGKTALIKALTGIETDRLAEEKQRGLSIELGFAYFDLPDGSRAGIVDVPGHERFIRQMLSGAYGMDLVMLVLDAREGVEEQTLEHLEILDLLGISAGILVVTKCDIATPEQIQDSAAQATEIVEGTTLEGAPVVCVSAVTGEGIDELKQTIVQQVDALSVQQLRIPTAEGIPRLYVDRVFTISGFGAVVTGTLIGGRLNREQQVNILPKGLQARIRGIQVHNQPADFAVSGQRTALNLSGVRKEDIARGNVVCAEKISRVTDNIDVSLKVLSSFPRMLEHWMRVRFYVGTSESFCRIVLLTDEALLPGDSGRIQLRLETAALTFRSDRFIIRDFSAQYTIGGGFVLNPFATKHKRFTEETEKTLRKWEEADDNEVIRLVITESRKLCLQESLLRYYLPYGDKKLDELLKNLQGQNKIIRWPGSDKMFSSSQRVSEVENIILQNLSRFHADNPLVAGQNAAQVKAELDRNLSGAKSPLSPLYQMGEKVEVDDISFEKISDRLIRAGKIVKDGNLLRLASHQITFAEQEQKIKDEIEKIFLQKGISSPSKEEIIETLKAYPEKEVEKTFYALVQLGTLIQISEGIFLHTQTLQDNIKLLKDAINQNGKIATAEFRELANTSRKYAVPFLEYCDSQGITRREGNYRYLRKRIM